MTQDRRPHSKDKSEGRSNPDARENPRHPNMHSEERHRDVEGRKGKTDARMDTKLMRDNDLYERQSI